MGVVGERLDIDFIISTGDNIYDDGIANTSDRSSRNLSPTSTLSRAFRNLGISVMQ
jgi:phosphodiesterase/alkaline phosphatase D-like protein